MVAVAGGTIELWAECKWLPLVPEEGILGLQLRVCVLKVILNPCDTLCENPFSQELRNCGRVFSSL